MDGSCFDDVAIRYQLGLQSYDGLTEAGRYTAKVELGSPVLADGTRPQVPLHETCFSTA